MNYPRSSMLSPATLWALVALATTMSQIELSLAKEDSCSRLKNLDYEFFGTKTLYEDARKFIEKNKDDKELPDSFSEDSLEKEHRELLEESCVPMVFYFIGRHSARFPDAEDIELYNKNLRQLTEKLRRSETFERCPEKFEPFLNWVPRMKSKHDNLITDLGADQQREIGRRFKRLYPEFFNTNRSDVKIGVTGKIRTAQTGAEFLKEVDGFRVPQCDRLPSNDLNERGYDIDKILKSECYKELIDKHELPFLDFHKECKKINGNQKANEPLVERVKEPRVVKEIAERVSKKLGLSSRDTLSYEMLDTIYNMCKFENALKDNSIWCTLFEKQDVEALEYIADVDNYIEDAYGRNAKIRQACPMIKDLIESFQDALRLTGTRGEKRRSYFYFSHAEALKKMLGAFGVFRDDDSFSEKRIREFVDDLKVPKNREWRSSLIVPFSANMAFILYRCQQPRKPIRHKILATITERPVKLGGCKDADCSSNKFFDTYDNMRTCDLSWICRPRPGQS